MGDGSSDKAATEVFFDDGEAAPPAPPAPVEKKWASPAPIILAGASTAQMVVLKKIKEMANAGRPLPYGPLMERVLLGSAGLCAVGGVFSALGILKFSSFSSNEEGARKI